MSAPLALFVTRHSPRPREDGSGAYLHEMVSFLAAHGVRCHFAWLDQPEDVARAWRWLPPPELASVCHLHFRRSVRLGPAHWFPERLPIGGGLATRLGARFRPEPPHTRRPVPFAGIPAGVARWFRPLEVGELAFVARLVRRLRPTALIANYPWLGGAFAVAGPAARIVLTHNVWHQKAISTAALGEPGRLAHLTPATEAAMLGAADHVVAISEDDCAAFAKLVPAERVLFVPKAVAPRSAPGPEDPDLCLCLGSANPANRAGLDWLLAEVWPLVRRDHPAARLRLCGRAGEGLAALPPGVENLGYVEHPESHYGAAALALVPLRHGGGVKIKLLEALAFGKPVVTTSIGLQGLGFLVASTPPADSAESFAAQIVGLLRDPAARATRAAESRRLALERFSLERCYRPLLTAIAGPAVHAAC